MRKGLTYWRVYGKSGSHLHWDFCISCVEDKTVSWMLLVANQGRESTVVWSVNRFMLFFQDYSEAYTIHTFLSATASPLCVSFQFQISVWDIQTSMYVIDRIKFRIWPIFFPRNETKCVKYLPIATDYAQQIYVVLPKITKRQSTVDTRSPPPYTIVWMDLRQVTSWTMYTEVVDGVRMLLQ